MNRPSRITHLLHFGVTFETKLIIVGKIGKLLLCQVDAGLGNEIHFSLLKLGVEFIHNKIESGALNFASLVHERDAEQFSFTPLVGPSFDLRLLSNSCLDCPTVLVWAETFDRKNRTPGFGTSLLPGGSINRLLLGYR